MVATKDITDNHLRAFVVNIFTIVLLLSMYGVVFGRCYMERNYVPILYDTWEWMSPILAKSTVNGCGLYGSHYATYKSRIIILSGDV